MPNPAPDITINDVPAIELVGISKAFGPVQANRDIAMKIPKGAITGIIGENGAGKSTLMSILYGLYQADRGEIIVDGQGVDIRKPEDAIAAGIGMVHQHFMLVDTFTVLENIVLGAEGGPLLADGIEAARQEIARLSRDYGLHVEPDALIADLPVGEQQRVEILKVLFRGAKILILDEPSAVLTPQETDQLFRILEALRARGTTVILITHKLREIMAATSKVYVMRHGEVVAERATKNTSREELAELMVGRKVRLSLNKQVSRPGKPLLVAEHLSWRDERGIARLEDVSFTLREGEIVGIAGVSGNGQSELLELLSGIRKPQSGRLTVMGRVVCSTDPADPALMRDLHLAHVPEDRHRFGMVGSFPASETAMLGYQKRRPFTGRWLLNGPAIVDHCARLMERFDVRPRRPEQRSSGFSGGNQQKLILAREMAQAPKVLLVGQPTRGVDIGAIEFIHRQLVDVRDAGCGVLIVSVELDEVMSLADRILVMCGGRVVGEVPGDQADERMLGLMMANAAPEQAA